MGNYYCLANFDKKEYLTFSPKKEYEILGNKEQTQLIAFYLFERNGDRICFLGDEWNVGLPFEPIHYLSEAMKDWKNVTEEVKKDFAEYVAMWEGRQPQKLLEMK